MRVYPVVAWWDFWIGAYWDRVWRKLYIFPLPCFGFCIAFGQPKEPA